LGEDFGHLDLVPESSGPGSASLRKVPGWSTCCADGTLYTGITTDLKRRCRQHNEGAASRYTRGRRPVGLVYQEAQATWGQALRREAAIKSLPRRAKESLIRRAG